MEESKLKQLYNVKNQNGKDGILYEQVTDLTVGLIKTIRTDLIVKTNDSSEYVEQYSAGTYTTKDTNFNTWTII